MARIYNVNDFEDWRLQARALLAAETPPAEIIWCDGTNISGALPFAGPSGAEAGASAPSKLSDRTTQPARIPRSFLATARQVACHTASDRYELLYRILWRLTHGEPDLLYQPLDPDLLQFRGLEKAIRRDCHKMKAFVRFQKVGMIDGKEEFFAFHRPDYRILREVAPFFSRRFGIMQWTIATPYQSVRWQNLKLVYGPGLEAAPRGGDETEGLWTTYFESIFNPARLNPRAMIRELPVRHWKTLPEAKSIPRLIQQATARSEQMIEATEGFAMSAADFLPTTRSLTALRDAAAGCQGCPLFHDATQTVFGEGPPSASLVLVGEQPGDSEDREGRPFVGPAGRMLNDAIEQAGLDRDDIYITNAVKHFKFKLTGSRRLHQKPSAREVSACKPWLQAELATIEPKFLVCLGATAAQALFGPAFRITKQRGEIMPCDFATAALATYHPSAILRMPDPASRDELFNYLVADLKSARQALKG